MNITTHRFGVIGSTGFLGRHVIDYLHASGIPAIGASRRTGVDARNTADVVNWIESNSLTHIINLAAECGGIGLNRDRPADLWRASTLINAAVLDAIRLCPHVKLTLVGTVCSYAANCPTPFREADLMNHGFPEYTNSAYGLAKLASYFGARAYRDQYGLKIIYMIPVNMYGPYDHFSTDVSHVIPALIRKFVTASQASSTHVTAWGTGVATREFLYAPDAAQALVKASVEYDRSDPINIGSGAEISMKDLTALISDLVGFTGRVEWDTTKPDGQLRRSLDVTRARELLGWEARTQLPVGLRATIDWYKANQAVADNS